MNLLFAFVALLASRLMALGLAAASINTSLDTIFGTSSNVFVKLHLGDPGAAGTANAAVNTTRAAVQFAAAASSSKASNSDAAWTSVSTTETYTHISIWSTVGPAGGTFLGSGTVSGGAVTAGNDFKIASGSLTASISGAA